MGWVSLASVPGLKNAAAATQTQPLHYLLAQLRVGDLAWWPGA